MFFSKKERTPFPGAVVGTIYSLGSLGAALKLSPGEVDFLEVRVDEFATEPGLLDELQEKLPELEARFPLILTVRRPDEGGAGALSLDRRRDLFGRFLRHASLVDVELRSATDLETVLANAHSNGLDIILSYHDFQYTPPLERLLGLAAEAARAGATVFKLAATAPAPEDAAVLMEFLGSLPAPLPLAVMGMGAEGRASRLSLGSHGSVLNYGYLDEPQVSGQWPAIELKKRLIELAK